MNDLELSNFMLAKHAKEYIETHPCTCKPESSLECWRCIFQYDLAHVNAYNEHFTKATKDGKVEEL